MNQISKNKQSLTEILKIEQLQEMLTDYFGGACFVVDNRGHLLTTPQNLCAACKGYFEIDSGAVVACKSLRSRIKKHNKHPTKNEVLVQYCERTGLCESLCPITVAGHVFGFLFLGQVCTEKTDKVKLEKLTKHLQSDKGKQTGVAPVEMSEKQFKKLAVFANDMTTFLARNMLSQSLLSNTKDKSTNAVGQVADYYNSFSEQTPLGYQSLDVSGHILEVNDIWLKTLGYEKSDVIGQPFMNFLAPEDKELFVQRFSAFLERGEVTGVNFTMTHKNGSYVFVQFNGRTLNDMHGNALCTHCVMVDMSKEEHARELIGQAHARAVELMQSQSRFLSSISHELRTPLNSIIGFSEMMKSQVMGELPAVYKEYVDIIYTSGQHLLGIVNDLLDLSRLRATGLRFDSTPVNATQQVRNVLQMMAPEFKENNINFVAHGLETKKQLHITSNAKRFRQVLINVLSNAAKFARSGTVNFTMKKLDDTLHISVRDNGPGMSQDQVENALTPFGRNDCDPNVRSCEGTGLGLPLAYQIVSALGGCFTIETWPGEGTTIHIALPMTQDNTLV